MKNFKEVFDIWSESWAITERTKRDELLKTILADDFRYTDPLIELSGLNEVSDYIAEFHKQSPGITFAQTNVVSHHNKNLVKWNTLNENKEVIDGGSSFVLVEDNKLKDITGFFDVENYPDL